MAGQRWMLAALILASTALADDAARARELVAQLGAEDASARDAAQAELERLGAADETGAVEGLLTEATKFPDPEVSSRACAALRSVRYWDHIVVVGGNWGARAVDLEAGVLVWKRPGGCDAWVGARKRGALAYISPRAGGVEAVDLRTGAMAWSLPSHARGWGQECGLWVGSDGHTLTAVDMLTGRSWDQAEGIHLDDPTYPRSLRATAGTVYVGSRQGLSAFDAKTGAPRWQEPRPVRDFEPGDGRVIVWTADAHDQQAVLSLQEATGEVSWRTGFPEHEMLGLHPVPHGASSPVLISHDSGTSALDGASGIRMWNDTLSGLDVKFGSAGKVAYVSTGTYSGLFSGICVVSVEDGRTLAEIPSPSCWCDVLEDGDRLLVSSFADQDSDGPLSLRSFDRASFKEQWSARVRGVSSLLTRYQGGHIERMGPNLVLLGESGAGISMELIDPATGEVIARQVLAR